MNLVLDNHTQTIIQIAVSVMLCIVKVIAWRTQMIRQATHVQKWSDNQTIVSRCRGCRYPKGIPYGMLRDAGLSQSVRL